MTAAPLPPPLRSVALRAAVIAGLYLLVASLWIYFSDRALAALVEDADAFERAQTYKGWFFVVATAAMLFWLVHRGYRAIDRGYASFREAAELLVSRDRLLTGIALGQPLQDSLGTLVEFIEEQIPDSRCTVLLLEADGVHVRHGAMPHVPKAYADAIDGAPIGPVAGSCGTAMYRAASVHVADIATDPLWADYKAYALPHGLRACWSTPIFGPDRRVLGSFAVYKDRPGLPNKAEERLMDIAASLASLALGHERTMAQLRESEERFQTFMDASPAIAWVTDAEGRHVYMNKAWEEAFQRDRQQWLGRTAAEIVPTASAEKIRSSDVRVLQEGQPTEFDDRFEIDGREVVWHLHKFPFANAAGEQFIGGIAVDITERSEAEDAVRELEGRLQAVVENLREGLIISDRSGDFVHWNPAALRMIGEEGYVPRRHRSSGAYGAYGGFYDQFDLFALDGSVLPRDQWPLARVRRGETLQDYELIVRRRDTDWERVFSYSGQRVSYATGHELLFLTLSDITQRKAAERALRESRDDLDRKVRERTVELEHALERAESADRLKSAFLATMSHELRTPLNSIIGFTGIVLQGLAGPLTAEQQKQLGMVRGSARHLLALINDVLDLSKIEAGQLEIHPGSFALHDAVERCVASIRPMAERKGLGFEVALEPGIDQMHSDQRRVEQILLNLLNNAAKFTERGHVRLEVAPVVAADGRRSIRFAVSDTGIGIAAEHLGALFQPFRQVDSGLQRLHEGTGLGLSICRRLATMLGGEISVESVKGEGSCFTVVLPAHLEIA